MLSVSLTGSSLTVTDSADSLPQAAFIVTVGKHSSSISGTDSTINEFYHALVALHTHSTHFIFNTHVTVK